MNITEWKKERNDSLDGELVECDFCDYFPKDYLDFVEHREKEHGIKAGKADIYK